MLLEIDYCLKKKRSFKSSKIQKIALWGFVLNLQAHRLSTPSNYWSLSSMKGGKFRSLEFGTIPFQTYSYPITTPNKLGMRTNFPPQSQLAWWGSRLSSEYLFVCREFCSDFAPVRSAATAASRRGARRIVFFPPAATIFRRIRRPGWA